ncbi:MAG: alpha-E domain-containing protein [Actinomycetota bacterium]
MLARHAENLFWAGRYIERAQDTARMLDVTFHEQIEAGPGVGERAWSDLLSVLHLRRAYEATGSPLTSEAVTRFLVLDSANAGAVVNAVYRARENARSVRDQLSAELYEAFNDCHLELVNRDVESDIGELPAELYESVKRNCQGIMGTAAETLPRDDRWRFLMLGVLIERAEMTCRLLEVHVRRSLGTEGSPVGTTWNQVLDSASASEAFVRSQSVAVGMRSVLAFLLLDRSFPRSVFFALRSAEQQLGELDPDEPMSAPRRELGRIRSELEFREIGELVTGDVAGFLSDFQERILHVAELLAVAYFRGSDSGELHLQEVRGGPLDDRLVHPGGLVLGGDAR